MSCIARWAAATTSPPTTAAQGFAATIECCIHYLTLDEENDVARLGGKAKINPPIRPRAEVEKLWRQVAAGNVTLVSTDHVSWSEDRKTNPDMLGERLRRARARGDGAAVRQGRAGARHPADLGGAADGAPTRRGISASTTEGRARGRQGRRHRRADAARPYVYDAAASGHNVVGWSPYNGIELPWTVRPRPTCAAQQVFDGTTVATPGTGDSCGRGVRRP